MPLPRFLLLITAATLGSAAAAQSVGTPAVSNTAGVNRSNMNQLICKSQSETGSRMKRKFCGTRAQWDKYREYQLIVAEEFLGGQGYSAR